MEFDYNVNLVFVIFMVKKIQDNNNNIIIRFVKRQNVKRLPWR